MHDSFLRQAVCVVLIFILSIRLGCGEETATVTTSDPVTFVQGTSRVTRPVGPNEVFSVVAVTGDKVTIADSRGFQAALNRNSLKMTGPAPPPSATNSVSAPQVAPHAVTTTPDTVANGSSSSPLPVAPTTNGDNAATSSGDPSPEDAAMLKQLDDAFQAPLFTDTHLWDDDVADVAARLKWPQESKTSTDASYRRYALGDGASMLGARAYSMALYGRNGHPTYISIVFANKGDFPEMAPLQKKLSARLPVAPDESAKAMGDLNTAVKADADTIDSRLTAVLGTPETHVFGPTADSRESVHRWDWKGHAILLSAPRNQYAAIKVVPSEVADHFGDVANMDRETIKEELARRVLKKDNGDVLLQEIPMVDQGPKGYCVPATWERYLRYVDVPADMYVLAMLGNSGMGGGTNLLAIRAGVNDYVGSYGRRIETANVPLDVAHIGKFIDQGLPLMWACFVLKNVEENIDLHTAQRKTVTDWESYKAGLQDADKTLVPLNWNDPEVYGHGHMRMIIGYNEQTNELAISDSWGDRYTARWMTVKEGQTTTQNDLEYVQW
jgi:hypothetical protein